MSKLTSRVTLLASCISGKAIVHKNLVKNHVFLCNWLREFYTFLYICALAVIKLEVSSCFHCQVCVVIKSDTVNKTEAVSPQHRLQISLSKINILQHLCIFSSFHVVHGESVMHAGLFSRACDVWIWRIDVGRT